MTQLQNLVHEDRMQGEGDVCDEVGIASCPHIPWIFHSFSSLHWKVNYILVQFVYLKADTVFEVVRTVTREIKEK
jgi:hypothetical protein